MHPKPIFILAFSCTAFAACKNPTIADGCAQVACTLDFRQVSVQLCDTSRVPFVVDSASVFLSNGQKVATQAITMLPNSGNYNVLSDDWVRIRPNASTAVRFQAYKNGKAVVDTPFVIGTDCCHVSKTSGPDTVVVRL